MLPRRAIAITALTLTAAAAPTAHAHLRLLDPLPRHPDALKLGPCGQADDMRGDVITTYAPGETITIRWEEYVDHPGWYRVSFDEDGFDSFVDPETPDDFDNNSTILLENIPDNEGGEYEVEVTLPDVECDNCTLQVIQVMLDKPPYGDGNDLYYQCADLILELGAATSGSTGDDTSDGSTGDGSTGDGSTGDGSTGGGTGEPGGTTDDGGSTGAGGSTDASAGSSSDGGSAGSSTGGGTDSDSGMTDEGCGCRGDTGGEGARGLGLALLLAGLGVARRRRASGR